MGLFYTLLQCLQSLQFLTELLPPLFFLSLQPLSIHICNLLLLHHFLRFQLSYALFQYRPAAVHLLQAFSLQQGIFQTLLIIFPPGNPTLQRLQFLQAFLLFIPLFNQFRECVMETVHLLVKRPGIFQLLTKLLLFVVGFQNPTDPYFVGVSDSSDVFRVLLLPVPTLKIGLIATFQLITKSAYRYSARLYETHPQQVSQLFPDFPFVFYILHRLVQLRLSGQQKGLQCLWRYRKQLCDLLLNVLLIDDLHTIGHDQAGLPHPVPLLPGFLNPDCPRQLHPTSLTIVCPTVRTGRFSTPVRRYPFKIEYRLYPASRLLFRPQLLRNARSARSSPLCSLSGSQLHGTPDHITSVRRKVSSHLLIQLPGGERCRGQKCVPDRMHKG